MKRYHRLHGIKGMANLAINAAIDWFVRWKYLFVINLKEVPKDGSSWEHFFVESFISLKDMRGEVLKELEELMGSGRTWPFLEHFFGYGGRLWIAKEKDRIVGLRWTLRGGLHGFYCIPIANNEVVTMAEQIFHEFRGKGIWEKFLRATIAELQKDGISRLFFGVHCRNKSMLRAVQKARVQLVGKVFTINILGYHFSVWKERCLWAKKKGDENEKVVTEK
jgi:GNAT superfamily N-acetyltransferase